MSENEKGILMQFANTKKVHNTKELVEIVGWNVRNALLGEVYATPKPGLVDRRDTGSHKDMSYETFLASTEAITPYLVEMFKAGMEGSELSGVESIYTPEERVFLDIRSIGIRAEKAMNDATGHVNTHKGMIFTMGILLSAAGILARRKMPQGIPDDFYDIDEIRSTRSGETDSRSSGRIFQIDEILDMGCRMTKRILEKDFEEMRKREPVSHGEKLFHKYGERGIRGQAIDGFPVIRNIGVPAMRRFLSIDSDKVLRDDIASKATLRKSLLDDAGSMRDEHFENAVNISALIAIMSELSDTNVLTRSSYEDMEWLKEESKKILDLGACFSKEGLSEIEKLNVKCIEKNISPGGAADILAVTILLLKLEGVSYV